MSWKNRAGIALIFGIVLAVAGVIVYGYQTQAEWVGAADKNVWDYLDLLIVPAVLAFGAFWLNVMQRNSELRADKAQRGRETYIENQRAQDAALQAFLDQLTQLLLDKKSNQLTRMDVDDAVRQVIQARSEPLLRSLDDTNRRWSLVLFLAVVGLLAKDRPLIRLVGADLEGVNGSGAPLEEVDLGGANLNGANFREANFRGANLAKANLSGANFREANLDEANLEGANLEGADLDGAKLRDTFSETACLYKANLRGATLHRSNLSFARLERANLESVGLSNAYLREAQGPGANFYQANLKDSVLYQAFLSQADFSTAGLRGADLRLAHLDGAKFNGAGLRGATLSQANLRETDLGGADLREADLSGATLSGARLTEADLRGADLSYADLDEADLSRVDLREANLSEANLSNVNLSHAALQGALGITREELEQQATSLECVAMPDDTIYAGRYASREFDPALSFSVGDGWRLPEPETSDELSLEGSEESELLFTWPSYVFNPSYPSNPSEPERVPAPENAEEWAAWFQGHPNLDTSDPVSVTVGGVPGLQIDVREPFAPEKYSQEYCGEDPCVPLFTFGDNISSCYVDWKERFVMVDVEEGMTLVIEASAQADEFDEFLLKVLEVLDTVEWKVH